jgi:hypothetical protein
LTQIGVALDIAVAAVSIVHSLSSRDEGEEANARNH